MACASDELGRFADAIHYNQSAIDICTAHAGDDQFSCIVARWNLVETHTALGAFDGAHNQLVAIHASQDQEQRRGHPVIPWAAMDLSDLAALRGDAAMARRWAQDGLERLNREEHVFPWIRAQGWRVAAQAELLMGEQAAAAHYLALIDERVEPGGPLWGMEAGEIQRVKSALARARGDRDAASAHRARALELAIAYFGPGNPHVDRLRARIDHPQTGDD